MNLRHPEPVYGNDNQAALKGQVHRKSIVESGALPLSYFVIGVRQVGQREGGFEYESVTSSLSAQRKNL